MNGDFCLFFLLSVMFGQNVVFLYFILFYNIMLLDGFDVFPMMVFVWLHIHRNAFIFANVM